MRDRFQEETKRIRKAKKSGNPVEAKPLWYDYHYRTSLSEGGEYSLDPKDCVYYPLWKKALSLIPPDVSVADLGCGPGQFAQLLLGYGNGLNFSYGVDFSLVAIEEARRRNPTVADRFVLGSLYDSSMYSIREYDSVTLLETLEHLDRDTFVLRMIPRGCIVVMSVPSFDSRSHVRHFISKEEMTKRYSPWISNIVISSVTLVKSNQTIWIMKGVRS